MIRSLPSALMVAWLATLPALGAAGAEGPSCAPPERLMQWPSSADPTWSFCFLTPRDSSGASGSGLEIRRAFYNGHPVFRRAHAPVVNVFYEGGCGCARGWSHTEAPFEVTTATGPASGSAGSYAEAAVPPRTLCETGGPDDPGSFSGVAAEKLKDRLILTTQMSAAWERYTMRWTFRLDGTIEPQIAFASTGSACASHGHFHHNYWRFEFDLDGDATASPAAVGHEEMRRVGAGGKPPISVMGSTGRGYQLIPGPEALAVPSDSWSVGDAWLLKRKPDELGDAGGGCSIDFTGILDGEPLSEREAVVWYRGGAYHPARSLDECERVGPSLQPVGDWSRPPAHGPR